LDAKPSSTGSNGNNERAQNLTVRKERKRREAAERQSLKPLYRRIEKAEAALGQSNARKKELEARLAEPELYEPANKPALRAVLEEQTDNNWALAKAESEWLEATEALEALQASVKESEEV
jgi:ATP-binding cassette subfamily F protein 3